MVINLSNKNFNVLVKFQKKKRYIWSTKHYVKINNGRIHVESNMVSRCAQHGYAAHFKESMCHSLIRKLIK